MTTVTTLIKKERQRLNRERLEILNQREQLNEKIGDIDRELAAIEAYKAAKTGKAPTAKLPIHKESRRRDLQPTRARRGSRREALLRVIRRNPRGLTRGEILARLRVKGNRSGEMTVSNALSIMIKRHELDRRNGRYIFNGQ